MKRKDLRDIFLKLKTKIGYNFEELIKYDEGMLLELVDVDKEKFFGAANIILCKYYKSEEDKLEKLKLFKSLGNTKYTSEFFTNKYLIENNLIEEAIKIIDSSPNDFNAEHASFVLNGQFSCRYKIAIEGAKVINESKNRFNAYYARELMTGIEAKEIDAIEGAKIINASPTEEHAKFVCRLLQSGILDKKRNIVVPGAKAINEIKNPIIIEDIYEYINRKNNPNVKNIIEKIECVISKSNVRYTIPIAEQGGTPQEINIIDNSKNWKNSLCTMKIILNKDKFRRDYLKLAKLVSEIDKFCVSEIVDKVFDYYFEGKITEDFLYEIIEYVITLNEPDAKRVQEFKLTSDTTIEEIKEYVKNRPLTILEDSLSKIENEKVKELVERLYIAVENRTDANVLDKRDPNVPEDIIMQDEKMLLELVDLADSKLSTASDIILCEYLNSDKEKKEYIDLLKSIEDEGKCSRSIKRFFTEKSIIEYNVIKGMVEIVNSAPKNDFSEQNVGLFLSYASKADKKKEARNEALEMARLISVSPNYSCADNLRSIAVSYFLTNNKITDEILEINNTASFYHQNFAYKILINDYLIEKNMHIKYAKLILEIEEIPVARCILDILLEAERINLDELDKIILFVRNLKWFEVPVINYVLSKEGNISYNDFKNFFTFIVRKYENLKNIQKYVDELNKDEEEIEIQKIRKIGSRIFGVK